MIFPSGETTVFSTRSSIVAMAFPAGVMRHPFGKSKPPWMYFGFCCVASPILRAGTCVAGRGGTLAPASLGETGKQQNNR